MSEKNVAVPFDMRTDDPRADTEASVLGTGLVWTDSWQRIASHLTPFSFRTAKLNLVAKHAFRLHATGEPVTRRVLRREMGADFDACGGYDTLNHCLDCANSPEHLRWHFRWLARDDARRESEAVVEALKNGALDQDEAGQALRKYAAEMSANDPERPDEDGSIRADVDAEIDRVLAGIPSSQSAILTPWKKLNDTLGGLEPGTLTLVAGRPGMGKSAFLMAIAAEVAKIGPVVVYSLEMGTRGLVTRLIATASGVDHGAIRKGQAAGTDIDLLHMAHKKLRELPISVDPRAGLDIREVQADAARRKAKGGLALVAVDYAQLLHSENAESRIQEMGAVSQGLKQLAKDLNVPVVAAAQLNRAGDGVAPKLAHLRETGQWEQDADAVILIWSENEPDQGAKYLDLKVTVAKNRQGAVGNVAMTFDRPTLTFAEKDPHARP